MKPDPDPWVLVGIGSNLGDSPAVVAAVIARLRRRFGGVEFRASSLWRSAPVDCPPGSPDFVNAVVAFRLPAESGISRPAQLLAVLAEIESDFGRPAPRLRNAPRALDLDLLTFGALIEDAPGCTVPHPRALQRRFVLEPAAEVVPELAWPGSGRCMLELCRELRDAPGQGEIERLSLRG